MEQQLMQKPVVAPKPLAREAAKPEKKLSPAQQKAEERWNMLTTLIADGATKLGNIWILCYWGHTFVNCGHLFFFFTAPWLKNLLEYSFLLPKYSVKILLGKKKWAVFFLFHFL